MSPEQNKVQQVATHLDGIKAAFTAASQLLPLPQRLAVQAIFETFHQTQTGLLQIAAANVRDLDMVERQLHDMRREIDVIKFAVQR